MQEHKDTTNPDLVLCPGCGRKVSARRLEKHRNRRCPNTKVLRIAHTRFSLLKEVAAQKSYNSIIGSQESYRSQHVMPECETSSRCRHCGDIAIPGDKVCYACTNGGG